MAYMFDIYCLYIGYILRIYSTYGKYMVVMKKIEKPNEKAREEFISKGSQTPLDLKKQDEKEWTNILLRIKKSALQDIDNKVKQRMGLSRTAWLLEAIQEKLDADV